MMDKQLMQEKFNKAYRGLAAQGFEQSVDSHGGCLYNGLTIPTLEGE